MTAPNGEGHVARNDAAPKSHGNDHSDFATSRESKQGFEHEMEHFVSLREKIAASGYSLSELSCGGYLIARWNLTRNAPDLRAVGRFLTAVGGRA